LVEECLERFKNIDRDEITEIAESLNVSICEAVEVYEYASTSFKMYSEAFENLLQVELDEESNGGMMKTFFSYINQGYDYFKKAIGLDVNNNYSEERCIASCDKTDKKIKSIFKMYNETLIENYMDKLLPSGINLLSVCEAKCELIPLYLEHMKSDNNGEENTEEEEEEKDIDENEEEEEEEEVSELIGLVKRATKYCGTKSKAKISVTDKNYKYGIKRYKDAGTYKTALKEVNGCGPKRTKLESCNALNKVASKLGIKMSSLNSILKDIEPAFEPACNSHDICYACHKRNRGDCDDLFLLNMEKMCSKKYSNIITKGACNVKVTAFYLFVHYCGESSYKNTSMDTNTKCASCGLSIMNTLATGSFYLKK